mgnify:CR=1 FL=1
MAYTTLDILARVCDQVNIERPTNLNSLTIEQQQLLHFLDEQHIYICGKKDWWFLQRTGDLSLWAYITGTATVATGSPPILTAAAGSPFHATLTTNGKLRFGGSVTYTTDINRCTYSTSVTTAKIISDWSRGTVTPAEAYTYGQDEYALASDCDRVSWVLHWRSGAATITHRV